MKALFKKYFSLVKTFIPQKAPAFHVGLDIGAESCKLVELINKDGTYQILNWAIESIEKEDTAGTIKKLLEKSNITQKSPSTAVFGKGTLIRYIEIPRMSLQDFKKSFSFEIDKYLPFPKDQIFTDCYLLDPDSADKKMSVLVAAVKKEIINERIETLSKAGLQANFVTVNSLAIANVFNILGAPLKPADPGNPDTPAEEQKNLAVAILDMGEKVTNLMILIDNLPRFTRDIFIGGQELNKRLSNVMGIPVEEAIKLKLDPKDRLPEILAACESVLMSLISEIRLSFDYFVTEKNIPVSKLYLTGDSSIMEGIVSVFTKNLDITVELWNPFSAIKLSPGIAAEEITRNAPRLGVALGLALYEND